MQTRTFWAPASSAGMTGAEAELRHRTRCCSARRQLGTLRLDRSPFAMRHSLSSDSVRRSRRSAWITRATLLGGLLVAMPTSAVFAEPEAPLAVQPAKAEAAPPEAAKPDPATVERELCEAIETAAREHALPIDFFTRLLWKESRFRLGAVSPKGAQGIAQFMPGTAADRGLADPFDPLQAIPASARYLRDLRAQFGNLGLAAAAYNAGPARIANWIGGSSSLPYETQDYVLSITGEPAETWASPELGPTAAAKIMPDANCVQLAGVLRVRGSPPGDAVPTARGPWGVQIAGNFSQARAMAAFRTMQKKFPSILGGKAPMVIRSRMSGRGSRVFYRIRIPAQSRDAAAKLCEKLKSVGGPCIVMKT